jgi:hypothetical protein
MTKVKALYGCVYIFSRWILHQRCFRKICWHYIAKYRRQTINNKRFLSSTRLKSFERKIKNPKKKKGKKIEMSHYLHERKQIIHEVFLGRFLKNTIQAYRSVRPSVRSSLLHSVGAVTREWRMIESSELRHMIAVML